LTSVSEREAGIGMRRITRRLTENKETQIQDIVRVDQGLEKARASLALRFGIRMLDARREVEERLFKDSLLCRIIQLSESHAG